MLRLVATRAALGILTLFAVSALIFVCTQILPGDVASAVLGQQATPDALRVFRAELGLDKRSAALLLRGKVSHVVEDPVLHAAFPPMQVGHLPATIGVLALVADQLELAVLEAHSWRIGDGEFLDVVAELVGKTTQPPSNDGSTSCRT